MEIYSKRQDVVGFNDIASELHDATGGSGAEWEQAVGMGSVLDPTNPLYGGTEAVEVPETPVVPEPVAAVAPQPEPETAAEEDAGMEFDLDDFKASEMKGGPTPVADIGSKIDFDLELDSGVKSDDVPAEKEAPAPTPPAIDLDLPTPVEAPKPDPLEDEESAFAAEMSTKLDLAAAYQEIGDREGARELLDEVMRGGSDSQIERAKDMLSKLT